MNRRKIVKKITRTPKRFQSDRFKRVNVSSAARRLFKVCSLTPTEKWEVLIASPEEDSRELRRCLRSETSRKGRLDTLFPTDSRSCWSQTNRILNYSSWTTGSTAERSLRTSRLQRGKQTFSFLFAVFRLRIVQRAKELNVRLTNAQAKAKKESAEWDSWRTSEKWNLAFRIS